MTAQQNEALMTALQKCVRQELGRLLIEGAFANRMSNEAPITREELARLMRNEIGNAMNRSGGAEAQSEFIEVDEVCSILKISKVTLHKWKRQGKLPFYRLGSRILFRRSDVMALPSKVTIG